MPDKDKVLSDDPFIIYDILNKRKDSGDDLKYPPSFTPSVINVEEVNEKKKGATELNDINSIDLLEAAQKSKVRWAIEGDENKKFFHGILNSKHSQLAICGTLVDSERIVDPLAVKTDLERNVSNEEIKSAVWDCGTNKSPGPDGFTFEFFRRYWKLLEHDIVAAVKEFLLQILANRLSFVISGLISDVQSAFVSNRQILDGPFILNELLSWCKHKKFKAMVFKVDFEKAFDSIRWDYLQDILKMFGFGDKWCGWINGCLNSAMRIPISQGFETTGSFISIFIYLDNGKFAFIFF
ncbi:RNA-directed DNA polymerase, eukaryota [Tanacetum coccineum]